MPIQQTPIPDVIFTFRGMLVLSFGRSGYCDVGFLLNPPERHSLSVDVTAGAKGGAPELIERIDGPHIERQLSLQVTAPQGVTQYTQGGFMREMDQGDINDFQWTVDFDLLYKGVPPIHVSKDGFMSVLSINDGQFFTERKSTDSLKTGVGLKPTFEDFGKTAVRIGAFIRLQANSSAVFSNGGKKIFDTSEYPSDMAFGIDVSLSRFGPHPMPAIDADSYYSAIGDTITEDQKIHFKSTQHVGGARRMSARIDPQAVCFPAVLSQTPIS